MRLLLLGWLILVSATAQPAPTGRRAPEPPPLPRELRGMWIASVGNIDWPSRPGLPVAQQQAELRALFDLAVRLNLNTIVLQVRPSCDALYASALEPWSEYLTGRMGQAPVPFYDPLKFACDEAHARNLELHAWFNPFRARHNKVVSNIAPNHVVRRKPDWVLTYGLYQWMDPGHPEAREHVMEVALDLVRRYDLDGLHFDDYFYPYPFRRPDGLFQPFPDNRSYSRYRNNGGQLDRADWRRDNVNRFVEALYPAVHRIKPWVKVGISPFGIWRPNNPPGIRGLDQFAQLHADPKLWLNSGWCDYLAPQLYWPLNQPQQSFTALLNWWESQNTKKRLLVPGLNSAKIGDDRQSGDILNQVRLARRDGAEGVLFWNASSLRNNLGGLATSLPRDLFAKPALVPATPWLGTNAPAAAQLNGTFSLKDALLTLDWERDTNVVTRVQVLRLRYGFQWDDQFLNPSVQKFYFDRRRRQAIPDEARLIGIGQTGLAGEAAVWRKP